MQTAALYIRVSTEDQAEFSPDAQKRMLMEYAKKNDILVSNDYIYIDEGITGRKANIRPAFMKMIATAKSKPKPFDAILVHKFDRFSRSREDSIVYKSLLRKECDIKVISITEQLEDDKFSVILEAMLEAMAEYYSLNLSEEVTKGMTEKALRGGYQARPPLGYRIDKAKEPPVVVPEEAEIIRLIFHKYVNEGMTFFQISRYLNSLGLKTSHGKNFERRSIEYIIQNPTYIGYIRWNRTHNATNTIKDKSEWIIEKGNHEAIISEELFEQAQERFKMEYTPINARPITDYKHWLSGVLKCGVCGRTLTASKSSKSRFKHFVCNGYTKGKCTASSITENKVVPYIFEAFKRIIDTEEFDYSVKTSHDEIDVSLLEAQLKKFSEKEERIKQAYINGVDSIDEYKSNKVILLTEKKNIEEQIDRIQKLNQQDHKEEMLKRIIEVYNIITNTDIDPLERNRSIKSVVDKIVVNKKDETLDIYLYF